MSVAILQCGDMPADLAARFGAYGALIQALLGPDRDASVYDITCGERPASVTTHGAYLLTGSPAGVHDPLPWIPPLLDFIRAAHGRARLVGICFGHQAMAQALGGEVVKSPKGWGIGLQRYRVAGTAPWLDAGEAEVAIPASHQDQVVVRPPLARVVLESDFSPFAGLDYGTSISFQPHPEFTAAFGIALLESRRDRFGPATDQAIESHAAPDDCRRVAGWIGRFLDLPDQALRPHATAA
jgi:GMP synthase-like glutamine amidotransferase